MARYLFGRLLGIVIVLFVVSVVIFLLMHAMPGGPYDEDQMPLSAEAKANYLAQVWAGQAAARAVSDLHEQCPAR